MFLFSQLPLEIENIIKKNVKYKKNYNKVISQIKDAGKKAENYIISNQLEGLFEDEVIGETWEWEYAFWGYLDLADGF